jgi:N-methylhydantoinase B
MPLPEGCIVVDPVMVGSGYGDPLDRDPKLVLQDLFDRAVSRKFASKVYGVALNEAGDQVDDLETQKLRKNLRSERLAAARPIAGGAVRGKLSSNARPMMRIHECLDVVAHGEDFSVACRKCSQDFGPATGNYKTSSVHRIVPKDEITDLPPPAGRSSIGAYVEYYCPGCATLLEVETSCPSIEGGKIEPIWDIQLTMEAIHKASAHADRLAAAE